MSFGKGLDDAGISDSQSLDKNYWIQRVGEVSIYVCTYIYIYNTVDWEMFAKDIFHEKQFYEING